MKAAVLCAIAVFSGWTVLGCDDEPAKNAADSSQTDTLQDVSSDFSPDQSTDLLEESTGACVEGATGACYTGEGTTRNVGTCAANLYSIAVVFSLTRLDDRLPLLHSCPT